MISVKSDQKPLIVKWLIGCSVLFGIVILFLVGALFWLNQQSENISQYPKEYAHLYQNDDFVPPPNNIISEKDLQTYIEINQKLRAEVQGLTGKMQFSFELSPERSQFFSKEIQMDHPTNSSLLRGRAGKEDESHVESI